MQLQKLQGRYRRTLLATSRDHQMKTDATIFWALQFVQEVDNFITEMQALDADKVEEEGEGGGHHSGIDEDIIQNINNVDDQGDTEIDIVDQCLVFYRQIQIEVFYIDSLKSTG